MDARLDSEGCSAEGILSVNRKYPITTQAQQSREKALVRPQRTTKDSMVDDVVRGCFGKRSVPEDITVDFVVDDQPSWVEEHGGVLVKAYDGCEPDPRTAQNLGARGRAQPAAQRPGGVPTGL
jgi:hypothetical protein